MVDDSGQLVINTDPLASGYVLGYGTEGYPLLVDASGRILTQDDSPSGSLAALSDTNTVGAVSGQFLMYDGATSDWIPSDVILSLDDLSDVVATTPASGESLVYNGSNWVTQSAASSTTPYSVSLVTASGQTVSGVVGKTYSCDLSAGLLTIDMPAAPSTNDYVVIKDKGNSQVNYITVDGNGNNIDGQASRLIQSDYASWTLVWDSQEWIVV
jgi:hypothetical protein